MGSHVADSNTKWSQADQSFNGLQDIVANLGSSAIPENINVPIAEINNQVKDMSILNILRSLAAERETNPNVAIAREELSKQVKDDLTGGTPLALQKDLIKAGLGKVISTGVNEGSSAGNAILQNIFGRGALDYRDRQQAKAAALLNDNPQPVVGIDPGSAATIMVDQNVGNTNQRNAFQERNVARRDSRLADMFNRLQQSKQAAAQQAQNNAAARNQDRGMWVGAASNVLSALAGMGGTAL